MKESGDIHLLVNKMTEWVKYNLLTNFEPFKYSRTRFMKIRTYWFSSRGARAVGGFSSESLCSWGPQLGGWASRGPLICRIPGHNFYFIGKKSYVQGLNFSSPSPNSHFQQGAHPTIFLCHWEFYYRNCRYTVDECLKPENFSAIPFLQAYPFKLSWFLARRK